MTEPQPFTYWVHYKEPDKTYLVLGTADDRETNSRVVIALRLWDVPGPQRLMVRSVEYWNRTEQVPYPPPCNRGMQLVPRFEQVEANAETRSVAAHLLLDMTHGVLA